MSCRSIIKLLIPPLLLDLYRTIRYGNNTKQYIWEGIYKNFNEVPLKNHQSGAKGFEDFNKDVYIHILVEEAKKNIYNTERNNLIPNHIADENILLPLLIALTIKENKKIKILDLGGGLGSSYLMLNPALIKKKQIEYIIFEVENVCRAGNSFFKEDDSIRFISKLPDNFPDLDIVFLKSMLQYIEDYSTFLKKICGYGSRFIFFVKFSAVEGPTYATIQKSDVMQMAYWFINIAEITEIMYTNGYSLIYKSLLSQIYDQGNFPESHRMGKACNLLFEKQETGIKILS